MHISIRKFERRDIPKKVEWINDPQNNHYLHYDLPLEVGKTEKWFEANKDRNDRYDCIIEADGDPCGLIGLLNIDNKNGKAEYYISMGEPSYKGRGVATEASRLILEYAFDKLKLEKVYLYTEVDNIPAQRLFEKVGFRREGVMRSDLRSRGYYVNRIAYGLLRQEFYTHSYKKIVNPTPLQCLGSVGKNRLFMKREDLIPYSFGGNKARKARLFFQEIDSGGYDCVVTYGSSSSNHCRVVANMAAERHIGCYIISPKEHFKETANSCLIRMFGAEITACPVSEVHDTINKKVQELQEKGKKPYFIAGGGHGNVGTQAYVDCFQEIAEYEKRNGVNFDYIFHASGTGTTQAGLVCGLLADTDRTDCRIIGISIARTNPYGRKVILDSVRAYLSSVGQTVSDELIEQSVVFDDSYTGGGYACSDQEINHTIHEVMVRYGIPLDSTYTGKAYTGMLKYIKEHRIEGKNILFIHTGGTPLFFDDIYRKV